MQRLTAVSGPRAYAFDHGSPLLHALCYERRTRALKRVERGERRDSKELRRLLAQNFEIDAEDIKILQVARLH